MVNSNFPEFCSPQVGSHVESLKSYALPDFILALVAKECKSELAKKGRIDKKLHSMNEESIDLLYKIFVKCDKNESGQYALYRFYAYIASMYYKCEVLINENILGKSGNNYKVPVAVKSNGMYISIAVNKDTGKQVNKRDATKFYNMADDIKKGEHGTMLYDAIYASSVGFNGDALVELERLDEARDNDSENQLNFKTAYFENDIYSII
ncbi:hypothetical protein [Nitrosopumilus sp.]|uniref:hypothetical protein n=1 Tax=Nitrosopumilus sp. TaxID=2024843 RepID=UPI003B59F972